MKKYIQILLIMTVVYSFVVISSAADTAVNLNTGESYEFLNNSTVENTIQTSNPYIANAIYDYVIYKDDGTVNELGMAKRNLGVFKVPGKGWAVLTVVATSKPLEITGINKAFTAKPTNTAALHKAKLNPGQNYEFTNKGSEENTLQVQAVDLKAVSYDYAINNKDGTGNASNISLNYNTYLKIPHGARIVVTVNSSSKPVEFGGASQLFTGKISSSPALHKVTLRVGGKHEFVNNGMGQNTLETFVNDPVAASYGYKVFDRNGAVVDSNTSVSYSTSLNVPAGGRISVTVALTSKPIDFGGNYDIFSPSAIKQTSKDLSLIFDYDKIKKANTQQEVLTAVALAYSKLSKEQKQDDEVKDKAVQYSEYAIEKISTKEIVKISAVVEIKGETVKDQAQQAREIKNKVEELLHKNSIEANREIETNIGLKVKGMTDNVTASIDKSLSENLKGIDNIKIDTGEVIATIGAGNIEDEVEDTQNMTIEINKEIEVTKSKRTYLAYSNSKSKYIADAGGTVIQTPMYHVGLKKGKQPVNKLKNNIKLALPIVKGQPEYNCVFIVEGENKLLAEPAGGKYAQVTGKIEIETKMAGRYYVKENKKSFSDISTKDVMMKKAIEVMAAKGVISGKDNKRFEPDGKVSRAEFVKLIVRTLYSLDKDAQANFKDVPKNVWYYQYVASSKKEGLVNGYPDNTFKGKNVITKHEIIKVCAASLKGKKKYKYPNNEERYLAFKDKKSIPNWSKKYLALAVRESLLPRRVDGLFQGGKPMTRGETTLILYRLFEKM